MLDIVVGTFSDLFPILCKGLKVYIQGTIIINGYKYQWNPSNKPNTNFYIDNLPCFVVIPST